MNQLLLTDYKGIPIKNRWKDAGCSNRPKLRDDLIVKTPYYKLILCATAYVWCCIIDGCYNLVEKIIYVKNILMEKKYTHIADRKRYALKGHHTEENVRNLCFVRIINSKV